MTDPDLGLDSGQLSLLNKLYPKGGSVAKKSSGSKWDDVPEPGEDILVGGYDFKIKDVKVAEVTNEESKVHGCKMYIAELVVQEPESMRGTEHAEFFVVGSPDDPNGDDAETLRGSRGAKAFKAFCTAAGVSMSDDDEELIESLKGEMVFGNVDAPTKEGGRKGVKANGWFPVGENDPEVKEKVSKKAPKKSATKKKAVDEDEDEPAPKAKGKVAAKKKAKPEPEEEEEEEEEEETERPKSKKKPVARDEEEEEDEDADEDDDDEDEEEEEAPRPKRGSRR